MGELAEVIGVVDGKPSEEKCPVTSERFGENAISCLERFYSRDDCIEVDFSFVVCGDTES
jgi:hypothetical protein